MKEAKCPIAKMVCPRNNDPQRGKYCPAWLEYTEDNVVTGEHRITKECSFQAVPRFMIYAASACERPAAAVESTRNEIARGFDEIAHRMERIPALLLENRRDDQA